MITSQATDWDQLLQQSQRLAAQDEHGFPRFERDIGQVEALSSRLKAKTQAMEDDDTMFNATRLLAQENVNPRVIERALDTVEIRPTVEDVFNLETDSVQEYLERVHEMTVISSIRAVQKECDESFQDFMIQCMTDDWNGKKQHLFDTTFTDSRASGAVVNADNQLALPASGSGDSAINLSGREKEYVSVVQRMNDAKLKHEPFAVVSEFRAAAEKDVSDSERKASVARVWAVIQNILAEARGPANNSRAKTKAMLRGASRYLETGHAHFLQSTLQANRAQAQLGGVPSHKGQIQAFIRLREKNAGPFDFDAPGGADTVWQRVFLCLRSGFYTEACEIAERSSRSLLLDGSTLAGHLREWVSNERQLPLQATNALSEECERQRSGADRAKWQRTQFRYKFAVQTLLSGNKRAADTLLREGAAVFGTIEDFMWFMTSTVQISSTLSGGQLRVSSGPISESYKLQDLQNYIVQFPSAHYSQGGKEPLLYVTVLLLSLQFKAVIAFLAKDASSRNYRIDAPHIAIALLQSTAIDSGGEGDAGVREGINVGDLIHHYGAQFVSKAPEVALEYYILAAEALGNDKDTRAQLLKELLTESNAFGFLLGAGGNTGGALQKWIGSGVERKQMLEAVAYSCQRDSQLDWASELYMCAEAPRPALHLLNLQISYHLEPALQSTREEEELQNLFRRGSEAVNMLTASSNASSEVEVIAYRQLQIIYQLFQAHKTSNTMQGVQLLQNLDFIPLENYRLSRCTENIGALHDAVAQRIPALLIASAQILAASQQVSHLRTLVAFAGNLPQRVSQGTYRELSDIYNSLA